MDLGRRLEQYTIKCPQEILLVTVEVDGETDEIAIFKGFSSSLRQPTNPDPDIAIISDHSVIISIDRLRSPYNPNHPDYIQQGLNLEAMEALLQHVGV